MTRPVHSAESRHGRRVDGLPQEVPPGGGILTLGVLEGFLYFAEEFALTLSQKCVQCLCRDGLVCFCGGVAHQDMISIAVGAVVTASRENVEQTAWSGDK